MVGLHPIKLAEKIKKTGKKENNIITYNKKTCISYVLCIRSSMPNDKHLVEFYEHYGENDDKDIYNGKLMLRGYIKTSPPEKTRKKPALSAIFGVIILIAIAASGVAVFSTTLQQFDTRDDDFIDFIGADVWLLGNGIYLDLTIQTSGTGEILIGGDLSPDVTCTPSNDHEKYTCNNTAPDSVLHNSHCSLRTCTGLAYFGLHRSCPHVYQLVVRGHLDPDFLHHVLPL